MTESKPPPEGGERPAGVLPPATATVAQKPAAPQGAPVAPKPVVVPRPAVSSQPAVAAKPAVAPNAVSPKPAVVAKAAAGAAAAPRPAAVSATNGAAKIPAGSPVRPPAAAATPNLRGDAPKQAAAASAALASSISSREPARATAAPDPYPPLSGRPAAGVTAADANRADQKRITPRSPRTAIEPDTVGLPPRRSASARHPLVIIGNAVITFLVLLAVAGGALLFVGKQRFEAPGPLPQDRTVNIPRGLGTRDIADVLNREGVIDQPWVFFGGVLALKAREDLKAGEYQFKAHSSISDVVATMVEGRVVAHQLSIPEGLTSQQIVARLTDDDVLTGDVRNVPREGTLLPDTYNFSRGFTREQMIERMQQAQAHAVHEIWERRASDLPIKTPDQLVVLASLVEKETGKPEERSRVAAVFVNRLKQKMKLQSDPTIIYGLVGGKGTLGRPIMKSEITQATPYNTYMIDGLPPGPISNPGRASLEAAANPARTREIYFVADGTGGHAFAETYEQHQKNVARLRSMETDRKDQAPLDDQTSTPPPAPVATPAAADAPPAAAPRGSAKPRTQPAH